MGKFIEVPDSKEHQFKRSNCKCNFCIEMNDTNDNLWDEFTKNPRMTILQKKMTKAITKIEKREKSKINKK